MQEVDLFPLMQEVDLIPLPQSFLCEKPLRLLRLPPFSDRIGSSLQPSHPCFLPPTPLLPLPSPHHHLLPSSSFRSALDRVSPAMLVEGVTELAFDDVAVTDPDFPAIQGTNSITCRRASVCVGCEEEGGRHRAK